MCFTEVSCSRTYSNSSDLLPTRSSIHSDSLQYTWKGLVLLEPSAMKWAEHSGKSKSAHMIVQLSGLWIITHNLHCYAASSLSVQHPYLICLHCGFKIQLLSAEAHAQLFVCLWYWSCPCCHHISIISIFIVFMFITSLEVPFSYLTNGT